MTNKPCLSARPLSRAALRLGYRALAALAPFAALAASPASAADVQLVYAFTNQSGDAANPAAALTEFGGKLYGTTLGGGEKGALGTVFVVTPGGHEKTLHSFLPGNDGYNPMASLVAWKGALCGTTYQGGANNQGVVFCVAPDGAEKIVHVFGSVPQDGDAPLGGLTKFNGRLYGTTSQGGSGYGTIFSIDTAGTYTVVARFNSKNGSGPIGNFIPFGNKLYGVTQSNKSGQGTVFSIGRTGGIVSVYQGVSASAGLALFNSKLYGTTNEGGTQGLGSVFAVTPDGHEATVYSFLGGNDGAEPTSSLLVYNNLLYGTTSSGGVNDAGTVFSVSATGAETVTPLSLATGASPDAGLILVGKTLFGTAFNGGNRDSACSQFGCGTVFSVTP